jgi:hypothetical protein
MQAFLIYLLIFFVASQASCQILGVVFHKPPIDCFYAALYVQALLHVVEFLFWLFSRSKSALGCFLLGCLALCVLAILSWAFGGW